MSRDHHIQISHRGPTDLKGGPQISLASRRVGIPRQRIHSQSEFVDSCFQPYSLALPCRSKQNGHEPTRIGVGSFLMVLLLLSSVYRIPGNDNSGLVLVFLGIPFAMITGSA